MPEQYLDYANIDTLFEQTRRKVVPQGVRRHAFCDPARSPAACTARPSLPGGHWVDRVSGRETARPTAAPPAAIREQVEQLRGEHDVVIPLPLSPLDPKRHAFAVDVGHLQRGDLGNPQARAVGDAESGPVLQTGRGFEKTRHLLLAQHDRRPTRCVNHREKTNEVGPLDRHA